MLPLVTEMLTVSFSPLGNTKKLVIINLLLEAYTPVETKTTKETSKGVKSIDDTDKSISSDVLDNLQLDSRGAKDRLHKDDVHIYEGDEKLNPKSLNQALVFGTLT